MSLDVWFKDDIRNTLLALNETSRDTHARVVALTSEPAIAASYRHGYGDALRAVAIAFGIANPRDGDEQGVIAAPASGEIVSLRVAQRSRVETEATR